MSISTGDLISKDPQASAWPKGIDYTNYLAKLDTAETIATSTWAVTGADASLTTSASSIVIGSKKTQVKLSGGTVGLTYTVTNSIITSSGVHDDRSFDVLIENQ
jgi:hypothetical protein